MMEIVVFSIGILLLLASSFALVEGLERIAKFLRMSEFLASFLIMAFATSSPELSVAIVGSLEGDAGIVIGNIIGSNIVNLTLILGFITLLAKRIKTESKVLQEDVRDLFFLSALPIILSVLGNGLSRIDGLILISAFLVYVFHLYKTGRLKKRRMADGISKEEAVISGIVVGIALSVLLLSAKLVVENARYIASSMGLTEMLIGLFVVAISTSLPELLFGIIAAKTEHGELSLGDLTGAAVVNIGFVLGIAALIHPLSFSIMTFLSSSFFMLFSSFLFFVFAESDGEISWKEGAALIMLYMLFAIVEIRTKGFGI